MLRLYDARSGRVEEVSPLSPRLLRVYACGGAGDASGDAADPHARLGAVRVRLVTDLIRRTAERGGVRVVVTWGGSGAAAVEDRLLGSLNIHPADAYARASDPAGGMDVHVGVSGLCSPDHRDREKGYRVQVGGLLPEDRDLDLAEGAGPLIAAVTSRGHDPLALRLALLEPRYRDQSNLTWRAVGAASETLARWRRRVAEWAESPSAPMRDGHARDVREAFENDLDTPAALAALRRVERDPGLAAGSRFELFAHLDRLFGLDLAADVGRR